MKTFEKEIEVRWSDADPNKHVRHSAYYEYGAHARIKWFNENNFSVKEFDKLSIGPILFKEECSFIKEIHVNDTITINILKGQVKADGSKWVLHHEMFKGSTKVAHLTVTGAWMDLSKRKLTTPPKKMADLMLDLPAGEEFVYGI